jgi:predicted ATPase
MLIEFKLKNYRCFREENAISMIAGPGKELMENTTSHKGLGKMRLVRSAVVYGPNASGKSNLVEGIKFVGDFVRRSHERGPETSIPVQSFRLSSACIEQPSEFEITFLHKDVRYQYGFLVDSTRVREEWLISYPKGPARTLFQRTAKDDSGESDWYFGPFLKGEKNKLASLTRPDVLFLSVAAQFNHQQLSDVYRWFARQLKVVGADRSSSGFLEAWTTDMVRRQKDEELLAQIRGLISVADLGIVGLNIEKVARGTPDLPEEMPQEVREVIMEVASLAEKTDQYEARMVHRAEGGTTKGIAFSIEDESLGTRRLFGLGGMALLALKRGSVLVVDELDSSLHPLLARSIVELFHNPKTNPNDAQLIFNTHDAILLDAATFRRDQVWFTEKDIYGASNIYPLLDYSPRKGEALGKGYLYGKYGAIPIIGSMERLADHGPSS